TEAVGARQKLLLERVERRIGVGGADLAEQRLLGQDRGLLERAADAHAQDQRRGPRPAPPPPPRRDAGPPAAQSRAPRAAAVYFERFSQPPPLATIASLSAAPGTTSTWMTAGVLSPVFTRSRGERTIEARR